MGYPFSVKEIWFQKAAQKHCLYSLFSLSEWNQRKKYQKKLQKETEMKPSPAFWCSCIFKITLQPSLFKDYDSKSRIDNDLTYTAGRYDFPIPVARILLYVFCY